MKIISGFSKKNNGNMLDKENRDEFLNDLGLDVQSVKQNFRSQVYGTDIAISGVSDRKEADAIITNIENEALFTFVADCIPILFWNESNHVIAVAHASRKGTFGNISRAVVNAMQNTFDCNVKDIHVEIGPGIGLCCYQVDEKTDDILKYVAKNFGDKYISSGNIDLKQLNYDQCVAEGILDEHIKVSQECTYCGQEHYSFRAGDLKERIAGVICIKK